VPCWDQSSLAAAAAAVTSQSVATSPPERRLSKLEPKISKYSQEEAKDKPSLSPAMLDKVKKLFEKIDINADGSITQSEATTFWGKNWAKVNAQAMFNEVDDDANGSVTYEEWLDFWTNVVAQPEYDEADVIEEIDNIMQGGSWVDWSDGRST